MEGFLSLIASHPTALSVGLGATLFFGALWALCYVQHSAEIKVCDSHVDNAPRKHLISHLQFLLSHLNECKHLSKRPNGLTVLITGANRYDAARCCGNRFHWPLSSAIETSFDCHYAVVLD